MPRYRRSRMLIIPGWSWQRRATAPNGNDENCGAGCRSGRPHAKCLSDGEALTSAVMSPYITTRYCRSLNFGFGSKRSLDDPRCDDEVASKNEPARAGGSNCRGQCVLTG